MTTKDDSPSGDVSKPTPWSSPVPAPTPPAFGAAGMPSPFAGIGATATDAGANGGGSGAASAWSPVAGGLDISGSSSGNISARGSAGKRGRGAEEDSGGGGDAEDLLSSLINQLGSLSTTEPTKEEMQRLVKTWLGLVWCCVVVWCGVAVQQFLPCWHLLSHHA